MCLVVGDSMKQTWRIIPLASGLVGKLLVGLTLGDLSSKSWFTLVKYEWATPKLPGSGNIATSDLFEQHANFKRGWTPWMLLNGDHHVVLLCTAVAGLKPPTKRWDNEDLRKNNGGSLKKSGGTNIFAEILRFHQNGPCLKMVIWFFEPWPSRPMFVRSDPIMACTVQ